jgi:hypothetical protein
MGFRKVAAAGLAVLGVLGLQVGAAAPSYAGPKIKVTLLLTDPTYASSKAQATKWCRLGINDYDISKGSSIKLLNGSGDIAGLGTLNKVRAIKSSGDWYCVYRGTVNAETEKFYSIEIDGRSGPDYSYNELRKKKWQMELTL